MLDQNTDRMWYVIGAVIIGAAIIFIMNNTFPQLFASIGDTFESKTNDVTEVVASPLGGPNENLLSNGALEQSGINLLRYTLDREALSPYIGKEITMSMDVKATDVASVPIMLYFHNGEHTAVNGAHSGDNGLKVATSSYQRFSHTFVLTQEIYDLSRTFTVRVGGVYSGTSITSRNAKVELGSEATRWVQ